MVAQWRCADVLSNAPGKRARQFRAVQNEAPSPHIVSQTGCHPPVPAWPLATMKGLCVAGDPHTRVGCSPRALTKRTARQTAPGATFEHQSRWSPCAPSTSGRSVLRCSPQRGHRRDSLSQWLRLYATLSATQQSSELSGPGAQAPCMLGCRLLDTHLLTKLPKVRRREGCPVASLVRLRLPQPSCDRSRSRRTGTAQARLNMSQSEN